MKHIPNELVRKAARAVLREDLRQMGESGNFTDANLDSVLVSLLIEGDDIEGEARSAIEAVASVLWEEGYTSGHSNAMRQMSDEPGLKRTVNPYE